jgi:hypothetical protein
LRQRKQLYLVKHPETKQGGAPGAGRGKVPKEPKSGFLGETLSFVDDTSAKTGMSKSSVKQSIHRAEAIAPEVREAIAMQYRDKFLNEGLERKREGGRDGAAIAGRGRKKKAENRSMADSPSSYSDTEPTTRSQLADMANVSEHKIRQAENAF